MNLNPEQEKVAQIVLDVLGENADTGGCRPFYSPDEWLERGEEYGHNSVLILVHDGGDLAPYCNWDYCEYEKIDKLSNALEVSGYYVEQCTTWYSAVYRTPA